jgi:hypothetical protein
VKLKGLLIAVAALQALTGAARADEAPSCHDFDNGRVLDVGDSHTWYAGCDYGSWDTDAQQGRTSSTALPVVDRWLRPRHAKVVFDIATNDVFDAGLFRDNLRTLWAMIGDRKLVLVTTCADATLPSVNDVIVSFVENHPQRSAYVPWGEYACQHPELFGPDGVHFTPEGYEQRVAMVKQKVRELRARKHKRR